MQKPPAKSAPAPAAKEEAPVAAPPKSKKLLIAVIVVLLLIIAGGAGYFLSKGSAPAAGAGHEEAAKKTEPAHEAKFVPLGDNFTVNLQREEGDQYLQAGITLKILQPELEEKIKAMLPEIRSKLLFLLSAKKPSELQTVEGKKKLIAEIIATVDGVLGLSSPAAEAAPADPAASATAAPSAVQPAAAVEPKTTGVVDVLFTSFIIQ